MTQNDYYRGVETILNSEVAALAKVQQIIRQMKKQNVQMYFDKDFGP